MEVNVEIENELTQEQKELFDFKTSLPMLNQLIGDWSGEVTQAAIRREQRYVKLDIEELRQKGVIEADETFIPDRVIDGAISRDLAQIMVFLNAGYRLGIFKCTSDPFLDESLVRRLEQEFTDGMSYNGWYEELKKMQDGCSLHGIDYGEVIFDESKPLHVSFEHVGFDKLFYNKKVESLQDSEHLIRQYDVAIFKLQDTFVKDFGFDQEQVDILVGKYDKARRNDVIAIYKNYFKYDGIVHVSWFTLNTCNDWLLSPRPLRLGIYEDGPIDPTTGAPQRVPSNLALYPIEPNVYKTDEQKVLILHVGRGFLDEPQQEASTNIITSYVNRGNKANYIFGSPETDDQETSEMKVLDTELIPNAIYSKSIKFWSMPSPDPSGLNALQVLDTRSAIQAGQVSFATNNRKDSRKTATELDQAGQEQAKINSVSLAGFSSFLRALLEMAWPIVRSQALDDKIKLLLVPQQTQGAMGVPTVVYVNDKETLSKEFDVKPAGDIDVVESQAQQQRMQQDWPVVQTYPGLKDVFMENYLRLRYPKEADKYIAAMKAGDPAPALVKGLGTALYGVLNNPDEVKTMNPQTQQQIQQLEQGAQQFIQSKEGAVA